MLILNWDFDVLPITFDENFMLYARYLCSRDALGLKAARPSARATIGYLVYKTSCFVL